MAVLADFCARASVSADQAKGTSRWRNMPIDGRLRVQWRKALREEAKPFLDSTL
jgi:hypothetical protein